MPTRTPGFMDRGLNDTKISWKVPVDDEHFVSIDVSYTPLVGEEARAYAKLAAPNRRARRPCATTSPRRSSQGR